jgi:hypothetical protein
MFYKRRTREQRFEFDFPLSEARCNNGQPFIKNLGHLKVIYMGYQRPGDLADKKSDPADAHDIDLERVSFAGVNILPILKADQFDDIYMQIEAAAKNNVQSAFADYDADRKETEDQEQFENSRGN